MFINSVKQTHSSCSPTTLALTIANTDNTRKARQTAATGGYTLRSLQLLDYAMSDLEAQAPVIIAVTPQVLLASQSSVTVTGSPFAQGVACSALFLDGSVSTSCSAVSAVEILVAINANAPSIRPSLLAALTHNGSTFEAPSTCALGILTVTDLFFFLRRPCVSSKLTS
jgi:hypothetical protein